MPLKALSESPFGGEGGNGIETVVAPVLVEDEVVANLHLGADAQLYIRASMHCIDIQPQLRFGKNNPMPPHALVVPTIDEAREREQAVGELHPPHCRGLETVEGTVPRVLALEIVFVKRLKRQGAREIDI